MIFIWFSDVFPIQTSVSFWDFHGGLPFPQGIDRWPEGPVAATPRAGVAAAGGCRPVALRGAARLCGGGTAFPDAAWMGWKTCLQRLD